MMDSKMNTKKKKRISNNALALIAIFASLAILVGIFLVLNSLPEPDHENEPEYIEAAYSVTVDDDGIHSAEVATTADGEPERNGSGTLLDCSPADVASVTVSDKDGEIFTLRAHAHDGEAVEYSVDGLEDFRLRTGAPDAVAHDAAVLGFISIASAGGKLGDFGLGEPRLTAEIAYTDATTSIIRIGDAAPASAGTYIAFGKSDAVYLVADDAVESFFTKPTGFISLTVTSSADNVEDNSPSKLTLSGSLYPDTVVIEPCDDGSEYEYKLTSPAGSGYVDAYAAADITGSIRDLYAEDVISVNSAGDDERAFLEQYGLYEPYAEIKAEYPDGVIRLIASEPDADGNIYIAGADDGFRVIYRIQLGAVGWANTSIEQLIVK